MITYRHHVMSLVAVFLALAVGIVLGGGPLSEIGRADDATAPAAERRADETQRAAALGDEFAGEAAATLYAGGLEAHPTALLTMPGVDEEQAAAVTAQVQAAGGTVSGRYDVREALLDPTERTLVDTLGSQLLTQLPEGLVDTEAPTYVRMGQLIGVAAASTVPAGEEADGDTSAIRESLAGADLLTSVDPDAGRAPLVLVLLGDDADADLVAGLLDGLAQTSAGVVVAGDTTSGRAGGDLELLRANAVSEEVSTVDGVERTLGQVTAVLALIRELDGAGGSFGASGAEGAVPLG
ncbi:copper transporter [Nocardioides dongkuii]|uniref:copper transporter n=1 Tax=Nocardioides dongkuii TaxID=2760089 RepID=UPI001878968F|nr:copper transporter [Nocardioides dongkuii]